MLEIVKNIHHQFYESNDISYLVLDRWLPKFEQLVDNADAIIIATETSKDFINIVTALKTNNKQKHYLMPIFYQNETNCNYKHHTDGFYSTLSDTIAKNIIALRNKIPQQKIHNYKDGLFRKTIEFIYTRKNNYTPVKDRISKIGYLYPFIELFFLDQEKEKLSLLNKIEKQELISSNLLCKIQLCEDCSDSFLVFQETCPKCHSIDIQANDVIHHFPCAHVAPEYKYKNKENDQLSCPKCEKDLRHIGIDYDKPSVVYTCNSCDSNFQNAEMTAECHSCNKKNELDKLIETEIKSYQLTPKGQLFAEEKIIQINESNNNANTSVFEELKKAEKKRELFSSDHHNYIITIGLKGELLNILSDDFLEKLWLELFKISDNYIAAPIYKTKTGNLLKLLITNLTKEQLEELSSKLIRNIEILLQDNIGNNIKVDCKKEIL